jgi:hypothetical protein
VICAGPAEPSRRRFLPGGADRDQARAVMANDCHSVVELVGLLRPQSGRPGCPRDGGEAGLSRPVQASLQLPERRRYPPEHARSGGVHPPSPADAEKPGGRRGSSHSRLCPGTWASAGPGGSAIAQTPSPARRSKSIMEPALARRWPGLAMPDVPGWGPSPPRHTLPVTRGAGLGAGSHGARGVTSAECSALRSHRHFSVG